MPDQQHLAILERSTIAWNRWRKENSEIYPDLTEADLRNTDLRGIDFSRTDLSGADLRETILSGADLRQADLIASDLTGARCVGANFFDATLNQCTIRNANLRETNFEGANLGEADLRNTALRNAILLKAHLNEANLNEANLNSADLTGADLTGADLSGADLTRSRLDHTNLQEATIGWTIFSGTNLSNVYGLDTLHHMGPSTIGLDTLYYSKGNIPESFLRGTGVPEPFLEYIRPLILTPCVYHSCFISYSNADEELAERLKIDLEAVGVQCWLAPHNLHVGEHLLMGLEKAIQKHDKLLLLLSRTSVASYWVQFEVELALIREATEGTTVLFPIRLDDGIMNTNLHIWTLLRKSRHIGDFLRWQDPLVYKYALQRLLLDLKKLA